MAGEAVGVAAAGAAGVAAGVTAAEGEAAGVAAAGVAGVTAAGAAGVTATEGEAAGVAATIPFKRHLACHSMFFQLCNYMILLESRILNDLER